MVGTRVATGGDVRKKLVKIMPEKSNYKVTIVGGIIALTLGVHYGWVLEPLFGDHHWIHAIHGRLCYIPIVVAAVWFGLRGGLWTATIVSVMVIPYIFLSDLGAHNLAGELTEIIFYYAIATLTGALIGRELQLRRKNQEAQLQLENSQKLSMVGQMAAGVAHEIKNPIASIKGAIEILCDGSTPEKDKDEFRQIVGKETQRIDRTLKDFLEFARPREPRFERLNLSDTVKAGVRQIEANASRVGITLSHSIEPDVYVRGDAEKIHQVMLNLLLNAIEASPGGGRIEVGVSREKNGATITVRDHGKGIPDDIADRIFDPFYTTKSSGSGLGLAIVRQIVENHGGSVGIDESGSGGTTFRVRLPLGEETA